MTVAKEWGFKFADFMELTPDEQADYIAHSRITNHISAVLNKDADDKAKAAAKK